VPTNDLDYERLSVGKKKERPIDDRIRQASRFLVKMSAEIHVLPSAMPAAATAASLFLTGSLASSTFFLGR
jgi:hypothetical protein